MSLDAAPAARTGARILVDQLRLHGVDAVSCVPGESYLGVLDALLDAPDIRVSMCRHEAAAANMADADGKMTGRPGVALVSRGPGVCHAAIGLHTAFQDGTPMILLIGQVPRAHQERDAFQEIEYRRMLTEVTKWVAQVDDADRIPEFVARAMHTAMSGRPGPVALVLPEEATAVSAACADALPARPLSGAPGAADVAAIAEALGAAERPLVLIGGPGWTHEECRTLQRLAEADGLPLATTFRKQDHVDNRSPAFAGVLGLGADPALRQAVRDADLVLALGPQLDDVTTDGYTQFGIPDPGQRLIHVHAGPEELGRVTQAELMVAARPGATAAALAAHLGNAGLPESATRRAFQAKLHAGREAFRAPRPAQGAFDWGSAMAHMDEVLPEDVIFAHGAGNYSIWLSRHFRMRGPGAHLAPVNGAMGYGLPAAVAAKRRFPGREVFCLAGDGCWQMQAHELATLVQYGLKVTVLVLDNGTYGTIRMHQERQFPGRVSATSMVNPDFAAAARAYGLHTETVETTEAFAPALARCRAADGPALMHVMLSAEDVAPGVALASLG